MYSIPNLEPFGYWNVSISGEQATFHDRQVAIVSPQIMSSLSISQVEETVESYDYDDYDDECECDCDLCESLRGDQEQEKENTMSYDILKFRETAEGKRVEYLNDRAATLLYTKDEALQKQFGLRDDEYPQTPEELAKRFQDGKFVILDKNPDAFCYTSGALGRIRFRDPALKRDEAGYKTAYQKLQALFEDIKDAIMIKSADEGLAAVKTFETATIQ